MSVTPLRTLSALALACAALPLLRAQEPPAVREEAVELVRAPYQRGERLVRERRHTHESEVEVTADGRRVMGTRVSGESRDRQEIEVLGVEAGAVTSYLVVSTSSSRTSVDGKPFQDEFDTDTRPSTSVVELREGRLVMQDDDSDEGDDDPLPLLGETVNWGGPPLLGSWGDLLPAGSLGPGQVIETSPEVTARVFGWTQLAVPGGMLDKGSRSYPDRRLTVRGVSELDGVRCVVADLELVEALEGEPARRTTLSGRVWVEVATGRMRRADLKVSSRARGQRAGPGGKQAELRQDVDLTLAEAWRWLPPRAPGPPLPAARAGFTTRLGESAYESDGPVPEPPAGRLSLVRYPSPAGELAAYLSPPPPAGEKRPALLWAHGGFGGIGAWLWERPDQLEPFLQAGFVVLCPSWRGENENPGRFELFYGEVDDALAALDYLRALPYVDPQRVYMAGHSTGGTITLLTALSTDKLRAAISFGGAPDLARTLADGGYGNTPFDPQDAQEVRLRSPIAHVRGLTTPTLYFEGEDSSYPADAARMARIARRSGAPFRAYELTGGGHRDILTPLTSWLAGVLAEDTGPRWTFAPADEEVQGRYRAWRLRELTRGIASAIVERARFRRETGDLAGARTDLDHALELDPQDDGAWFERALVLEALDDLTGAIADYGRVIALKPEDSVAYYNRGLLRARQGDLKGGVADMERASQLDPEDEDAQEMLRRMRRDLRGR